MNGQARRSSPSDEDVRSSALRLLANREHGHAELCEKLKHRYPGYGRVSDIVDQLAGEGLQSDARFAEAFARERYRRGIGPVRVSAELDQRGLSSELVNDVLADAELDWHKRLAEVAERKFGSEPTRDPRELAQRSRFLQQRGFNHDAIRRLLQAMSAR